MFNIVGWLRYERRKDFPQFSVISAVLASVRQLCRWKRRAMSVG